MQRSTVLQGKSAVFTPLVIPLSKSFYPLMTGLWGTGSFNGKNCILPILPLSLLLFLSTPLLFVLSPSRFLCVAQLCPSIFLHEGLLTADFSVADRIPFAVLPARAQPFHATPLSTVDQLQATPAAFSLSLKAYHLDHTDHEPAAAAAAAGASITQTSFKSRPSPKQHH